MSKAFAAGFKRFITVPTIFLTISISTTAAFAQSKLYSPIPLTNLTELSDTLSEKDIPTGQGGFARDYTVKLNKGDNLAVDLSSENFDCIITLLAPDGSTVAENDDGPDGTSNSLLFTRINETGIYIIRVRSFGETGVGNFKLKVTKLQPIK
ncbi:PPC domain-containing protein [Nostoc sp. FACHB-87]|uniref:PPC domain-containing protein n=1 Tax=Nostocales TaxID=1161 RepID=UPI0016844337|nr:MULTISPECIES: PPC domain-containing protein [Nostocales]MBD2299912.1 PPC domain-containing protein [Nostoc sp. FACHB-190]MBD2456929.1 PPC domain-containing protein [Nostoc sp. FACHB-87]MBD2478781.1 PPC domain-containing protein [Anabaena sp. FACHB-83]MBD2491314.1 PPC domain-containing protein [Aulosira sp. FACHB-615]